MIRYGLTCAGSHGFDGWFRSSGDFDAQAERAMLSCPVCGSSDVRKALMAPAISSMRAAPTEAVSPEKAQPAADQAETPLALLDDKQAKLRQLLREFRGELTKNSENVGDRFPEVARQMHAEEIETRSIHGRATLEEAKALAEEGVAVHPLPAFPDDLN